MNIIKNKELLLDSINLVNKCINSNNKDEVAKDTINLFSKVLNNSIEQTSKNMFYNDNNFFEKMKKSNYKKFIDKIKSLNIHTNEYKLPIIVTIGNESSGKSSLIKNMIKCDILPIDKNICTKCPIKIELINSDIEEYKIIFKDKIIDLDDKESIKLHIHSIMNTIDGIIDDELYIKISNNYVINSTFYDLPGIREYPIDLREKSKAIINKYINEKNTLIICVIPANTSRLTSNQSLGMIIDAKKSNDCIIALSKVDLLYDEDDLDLFISRILLKNIDELKGLDIKKIIGVISSKNINENSWFNKNILNNIADNNQKKLIEKSITVENLLISIDDMFNNFISSNWKTEAINKTNQKILELENDYNNLGKEINLEELFKFIYKNIYNVNIFDEFRFSFNLLFDNFLNYNEDIEKLSEIYENYKKEIIIKFINKINNSFSIENEYKINRFTFLKKHLENEYNKIFINNYKHIDLWFYKHLEKFKYELISEDIGKFQNYIHINFQRYIYNDLLHYKINFNDKDLLFEDHDYINKRQNIVLSIKKYKKNKSFFENL